MFPLPTELVIIVIVFLLGFVFVLGVVFALLLNWLLKTPTKRYLVSRGIIAVVSYSITTVILLKVLPPLRWVNEQPQDLRTTLWGHLGILAGAVALICLAGWQFALRLRRKRRYGV